MTSFWQTSDEALRVEERRARDLAVEANKPGATRAQVRTARMAVAAVSIELGNRRMEPEVEFPPTPFYRGPDGRRRLPPIPGKTDVQREDDHERAEARRRSRVVGGRRIDVDDLPDPSEL